MNRWGKIDWGARLLVLPGITLAYWYWTCTWVTGSFQLGTILTLFTIGALWLSPK
jgi:hypothetical protein